MSHTIPSQGNINHSMRSNYNEFGVDEYYRKVNTSYRNPFFPGIRKVIFALLDRWWKEEGSSKLSEAITSQDDVTLRILDMAAGSGEATLVIEEWYNLRFAEVSSTVPGPSNSASHATANSLIPSPLPNPLASLGITSSRLPVTARPAFIPSNKKGKQPDQANREPSAEAGAQRSVVEQIERKRKPGLRITATDPFTVPAYEARTGKRCHPLLYADIAAGKLADLDQTGMTSKYDMVICSFALHLVGDSSEMWALLYELSQRARWLAVIAPHKKPEIKDGWGFSRWNFATWKSTIDPGLQHLGDSDVNNDRQQNGLVDEGRELVVDRVRCRLYRSAGN